MPRLKGKYVHENGQIWINIAKETGTIKKSTFLAKKDIYKGTWRAQEGTYTRQIDHVV